MIMDFDRGGTFRKFQEQEFGPSPGATTTVASSVLVISATGVYLVDLSVTRVEVDVAAAVVLNLPPAGNPSVPAITTVGAYAKNIITVLDVGGNAAGFPITINAAAGETIAGLPSFNINTAYGSATLQPSALIPGWISVLSGGLGPPGPPGPPGGFASLPDEINVTVAPFNADPTGAADSTAAIQAAIDYAFSHGTRTVYMPKGNYRTTLPIFLDNPLNGRGNPAPAAWNGGTTYAINATVTQGGIPWISLQNGNLNHTPTLAGSSANWTAGGNWTQADNGAAATGKFVWWAPTFLTGTISGSANFALVGERGVQGIATQISTNFNNAPAIVVGPGNGQLIESITINGGNSLHNDGTDGGTASGFDFPSAAFRWGRGLPYIGALGGSPIILPSAALAFATVQAGSRQYVKKVQTQGFCYGVVTGVAGDGLGDSNFFEDMLLFNHNFGFVFSKSQNFINHITNCDCNVRQCLLAQVGTGANVIGGNWSTMNEAGPACSFTISNVTNVDSTHLTIQITPATANPSSFEGFNMYDLLKTGQLNAFVLPTTHFGWIPFSPTAINNSTLVVTLALTQFSAVDMNLSATFDLMTELTAATTCYAAETIMKFAGGNINVRNILIEDAPPQTAVYADIGFGSPMSCSFKNVFFNAIPGYQQGYASGGTDPAGISQYINQYFTPMFAHGSTGLILENVWLNSQSSQIPQGAPPYKVLDLGREVFNDISINGCRALRLEYRALTASNVQFGFGRSDTAYVYSETNKGGAGTGQGGDWWWYNGYDDGKARTNYKGLFPDEMMQPLLDYSALPDLQALTPITRGGGGAWTAAYPPILGGRRYRVGYPDNRAGTPPAHRSFISNHSGMSYGQTIPTINWNFKGQSNVVNVDDINMFFPGFYFTLNNGVSVNECVCLGVYFFAPNVSPPRAGQIYVQVVTGGVGLANAYLSGVKTTVYSGTGLGQAAFNLSFLDDQVSAARLPGSGATIAITSSDQEVGIVTVGGAVTCTLPTVASWAANNTQGQSLCIFDYDGHAAANNISFTLAGADTFVGTAPVINTNNGNVVLRPISSTNQWYIREKR
jgi:hypothetical protein